MKDHRDKPFRDAYTDREAAKGAPSTPQTRAPAYKLRFQMMNSCAVMNCVLFACSWNC